MKAKNRRVLSAFRVASQNPKTKLTGIPRECFQPTNPCLQILIILLPKKSCLFFAGISILFPFLNLSSSKKKINNKCICQKSERRFLNSMCAETDALLIVFSGLNLAGIYFDLCVREAL